MCQEQRILDLLVEFHRRGGGELQNDRLANLSLVQTGGSEINRRSEERVLLGGLIFMSL